MTEPDAGARHDASATSDRTTADPPPPSPPPLPQMPSAQELGASALALFRSLGPRAERRGTPRFGMLVAVAGALVASIGPSMATGLDDVPAIVVLGTLLLLTIGGCAAVWIVSSGPLAAAGATASATSVFLFIAELLDGEDTLGTESVVPVVLISCVAWLAMYLVGPGRGHAVYLGFGVVAFGLLIVSFISEDSQGFDRPGASTMWGFVLVGTALWGLGYVFDRQGAAGLATTFVGPGAAMLAYGGLCALHISEGFTIPALWGSQSGLSSSPSLSALIIPGVAFVLVGLFALRYGAAALRRGTAWTGTALVAIGVWSFLAGLFGTNATLLALTTFVVGLAVVAGGYELSRRLNEADEFGETPSFINVGIITAIKDSVPVRTEDPEVFRTFGGVAWVAPATPAPVQGMPASQGTGWWLASDGLWYPPQPPQPPTPSTPSAQPPTGAADGPRATPPSTPGAIDDLPPAPGWWKASDGNWYAPETRS